MPACIKIPYSCYFPADWDPRWLPVPAPGQRGGERGPEDSRGRPGQRDREQARSRRGDPGEYPPLILHSSLLWLSARKFGMTRVVFHGGVSQVVWRASRILETIRTRHVSASCNYLRLIFTELLCALSDHRFKCNG